MNDQRGDFSLDVEEAQPARRREPDRLPDEWLDLGSLGSELHNALMEFPAEPSGAGAQTRVHFREPLSGRLSLAHNKRGLLLILAAATIGLAALAIWRVSLHPVATGTKPPERARATEPRTPLPSTADLPPSTVQPNTAVSAPKAADVAPPAPQVEPSRAQPDTLERSRAATTAAASPAAAPRSLEPLPSEQATLPPDPLALLRTRPTAPRSVLADAVGSVPPAARARSSAVARPMPERDVSTATPGSADLPDIQRVVRAYQESYNQLDARSTALVWPTVDTGALARAFSTLVAQQLSFDRCEFDVEGGTATASCAGAVRYVQRIGDPRPQVQQMSWAFELERTDQGWQIEDVTARGPR